MRRINVRVIAASNRDLAAEVAAGRFRSDLYYRLAALTIDVPPLRSRPEDIPVLARYFVAVLEERWGQSLDIVSRALNSLLDYPFPGNVRELENIIRRAIVMAKGEAIRPDDLPAEMRSAGGVPVAAAAGQAPGQAPPPADANDIGTVAATLFHWAKEQPDLAVLPAVERELIAHALRETNGNQVRAAKLLPDGRTVVLHVLGLARAMQFELKYDLDAADGSLIRGTLAGTINEL